MPGRSSESVRVSRRRLLGGAAVGLLSASLIGCDDPNRRRHADPPPDSMIDDVDPFIGTDGSGNTYPGAHLPFGFAAPSPDTDNPTSAGYDPAEPIVGFSQTHVSGTGGSSRYGNFRVTPGIGPIRLGTQRYDKADEQATPGSYAVRLTGVNIQVELTATRRCAVHRYTFPDADGGHLIIDAGSVININEGQTVRSAVVRVIGNSQVEGSVTVTGGWGSGDAHYTLYFAAELSRSFTDFTTYSGGRKTTGRSVTGDTVGAALSVDTKGARTVELRVALSFISTNWARATLQDEIGDHGFDAVRAAARRSWQDVLSHAIVDGGSAAQRATFATALYHCHLMPHDLTGDNPWWSGIGPHYEDYYTLWDTSRALHPLLTLLQPGRQTDMVSSLLATYQHTGWLPDARIAGVNCYIQGGTSGDVLVADAIVKGLDIDGKLAYQAIRKDGERNSPDPSVAGRQLTDYLRLGYLPVDGRWAHDPHGDRCASRTLEYAWEDFCISQVARHRGDGATAERYLRRSLNWSHLWDPTTRTIRPRYADGRWLSPFDPADAGSSHFYEGSAYQYTTLVPHDVQGLINRMGGTAAFVAWLDALFARNRYSASNEPDLHAPFLYLYAGRPDRTATITRSLLAEQYQAKRDGLPGNDDAGALSAWYVWTALGLYPNPGQDWYHLGSPLFPAATIQVGDGRTLRITATDTSTANRYVQRVTLRGKPVTQPWVRHSDLVKGGTLAFEMGPKPSGWATNGRPPSVTAYR